MIFLIIGNNIIAEVKENKAHLAIDQGGEICARREAKICAKYAQNMRNSKNGVGSGAPYLITQALLLLNMMIFLIRKKVLIILSTLKAPF